MPLQATSGAASYDAFGGGVAAVPNYIEDVFSTWLYTGNGSTQTINNGIDLAGKGGLVWAKSRQSGNGYIMYDTARGPYPTAGYLGSSDTDFASVSNAEAYGNIPTFNSNGYVIGSTSSVNVVNVSGQNNVSWTFRKQPKFFDVVTYTGNSATQNIAHNLGSEPGCIFVKRTDANGDWFVYHRSRGNTGFARLNFTQAAGTSSIIWNSTTPTSTQFSVGAAATNISGGTYVAYLFAHNAGGFGLSGNDNVISCGSVVTGNLGQATVNLGYEPQWVLWKRADGVGNWHIIDTMRGMSETSAAFLYPNTSGAESVASGAPYFTATATGFKTQDYWINDSNHIYIAIRRGPMRTPTTGTSVYNGITRTGTGSAATVTNIGFPPDMVLSERRLGPEGFMANRLAGFSNTAAQYLFTPYTSAEFAATTSTSGIMLDGTTTGTASLTSGSGNLNINGNAYIDYFMRRAPGFFDEVCYTGTGTAQNIPHNLGVVPELMIVKERNGANGWQVYSASLTNNDYLILNTTAGVPAPSTTRWNSTTPTSTVFSVGTHGATNGSGQNFVNYLFASCPGVSKVFSYTGNGSSQTINCGFTGGARFVMIKRTDSTGDWYVWDTARGIVANNDPHLSLNSTAAEVTTNDTIDTDSTGFVVNQVAATNVNVSSATYIGLAIA